MPPDSYVERNLAIAAFYNWCVAPHPNPTRMRSVTGPPGCGKTTFMLRLLDQLQAEGRTVVWYDAPEEPPAGLEGADILLADGYDEVDDSRRELVQQHVLIPFLFPARVANPQSRIVLARRDEYALGAARLRWEDVPFPLEGLADPVAQLGALLQAGPAAGGATVVVPAAVIAAMAVLDDNARAALVAALRPMLTPNPFVNLHLLERHFQHPATPLGPDDHRHCLERYVERAGLSGDPVNEDYVEVLIRRAQQFPDGQFYISQYDNKKELGVLVRAGVISHVPDSGRFQLEEAVLHLVAHL